MGWTLGEICQELGVSKASASLWCREVQIDEAELARRRTARHLAGNEGARRRGPNKLQRAKAAEIEEMQRAGRQEIGQLSLRDLMLIGVALYAGEGSKTPGEVRFSNSDPRMILLFVTWMQTCFGIGPYEVRFRLYLHQGLDLEAANAAIIRAIVTLEGEPVGTDEKGIMVLKRPFPGMTPGLWGEPERYATDYWQRIPNVYYSGDSAHVDADGYFWFAGRADEVIKIAAHRLGTIEVESAFLKHPAVAECGVVGRPDEVRGEVIAAFVLLKFGHEVTPELRKELLDTVRRELGAIAVIGDMNFVRMLPKTRSGKIMRRVLKAVTLDRDPGDITTIEDEGSVEEARLAWNELKSEFK